MNINMIKEINALANGTRGDRSALWAKAIELGVDNRNMYLYSIERLKSLTESAQAELDAIKADKDAKKASAKEAKENAFKAFVQNDERAKAMFAKMQSAKTEEEKSTIKKEAEELRKALTKEFNESYKAA